MIRITRAFCVELGRIVTVNEARREFLSLEKPSRFSFLCSEEPCRNAGIRVIGAAYTTSAPESEKFVVPYFRRWDVHLPGCGWDVSGDENPDPISAALDPTAAKRNARRKLSDFVDVFDPRLDSAEPAADRSRSQSTMARIGSSGETARPRQSNDGSDKPGETRTNCLDRLVDTYLEAKAILTGEAFSSLEIRVVGSGAIPLKDYFRPIKRGAPPNHGRVLFGGATLTKRYAQGFRLRFFDHVEGLPVCLYVSPDMLAAYRYRRYLLQVIEQADAVRYLKVFALGELRRTPDSIDLMVVDLHHLAIVLGPPRIAAPPPRDDSPSESSSTETR